MNIKDEYTAYCLDEAIAYISQKMKAGEQPQFEYKAKSFSEYYEHILNT